MKSGFRQSAPGLHSENGAGREGVGQNEVRLWNLGGNGSPYAYFPLVKVQGGASTFLGGGGKAPPNASLRTLSGILIVRVSLYR